MNGNTCIHLTRETIPTVKKRNKSTIPKPPPCASVIQPFLGCLLSRVIPALLSVTKSRFTFLRPFHEWPLELASLRPITATNWILPTITGAWKRATGRRWDCAPGSTVACSRWHVNKRTRRVRAQMSDLKELWDKKCVLLQAA